MYISCSENLRRLTWHATGEHAALRVWCVVHGLPDWVQPVGHFRLPRRRVLFRDEHWRQPQPGRRPGTAARAAGRAAPLSHGRPTNARLLRRKWQYQYENIAAKPQGLCDHYPPWKSFESNQERTQHGVSSIIAPSIIVCFSMIDYNAQGLREVCHAQIC